MTRKYYITNVLYLINIDNKNKIYNIHLNLLAECCAVINSTYHNFLTKHRSVLTVIFRTLFGPVTHFSECRLHFKISFLGKILQKNYSLYYITMNFFDKILL